MSKSSVIMFVIFGVVLVAAVAGVVFGVATHHEPGFMSTRPSWTRSDFPLVVCAHAYVGDDGVAVAAVQQATNVTDQRLGFQAYGAPSGADAGCDVRVTVGVPSEAGWRDPGGDAQFRAARLTGIRCDVTTTNTGTDSMLSLVLQHELGHCLGLDHDDYRESIMFGGPGRALQPVEPGTFPPHISDSDRDLLRQTYGAP